MSNSHPKKLSHLEVTFRHGASWGSVERYTDSNDTLAGFQSVPSMEVGVPSNVGTLAPGACRILLPIDAFTSNASNSLPHSPIWVEVDEVTSVPYSALAPTRLALFRGRVKETVRNHEGKRNVVAFFAVNIKERLAVPLGISANDACWWSVFDRGCALVRATYEIATQIDSADGMAVVITTAGVTSKTGFYWKRGYIEKDGLRVTIKDWSDAAPTEFQMVRRVPTSWIGGTGDLIIVPGCDQSIETCRDRFNNEPRFMGVGIAIPAYQPNFEPGQ
jgi:hypothetical protein